MYPSPKALVLASALTGIGSTRTRPASLNSPKCKWGKQLALLAPSFLLFSPIRIRYQWRYHNFLNEKFVRVTKEGQPITPLFGATIDQTNFAIHTEIDQVAFQHD